MKRRGFLAGSLTLIVAGGAAWKLRLFAKHYPPTPYDDLLNQIVEREPAMAVGALVLRTATHFDTARTAAILRQPGFALANRAPDDAGARRLEEADGWLIPQTLAQYAALARAVTPA